tara:strand:- start:24 stop:452 length:429 start_codon:yes stop_codon:yes gene_type:complete
MYFPGRPWALIKKFLGVRKHPTAIIMHDFVKYARGICYDSRTIRYKYMLTLIKNSLKQTEFVSTIDNTSQMFSIKIPKYLTKYELEMIRIRKYIEVVQVILKPKKDEHYYQVVIVPVQKNIFYNETITWRDKQHKDKFIISL